MPIRNLHIPPATLYHFECIRERPSHAVHRLAAGERRFILKSFTWHGSAKEIQVYELLERLGVPTLPVYLRGDDFLLIEDLQASPTWRLAKPEDMQRAEVGAAVAQWYRVLHQAGFALAQADGWPPYLHSWIDPLQEGALWAAGCKLGISESPAWRAALAKLEDWKAAYRAFPQTFNYSDFADENLALTREGLDPMQAIVYDYDCFSTGSVFSDVRNVLSSLSGPARGAFLEAYGPVDMGEEEIDTPLSTLEGILVASQRERVPAWARGLIEGF